MLNKREEVIIGIIEAIVLVAVGVLVWLYLYNNSEEMVSTKDNAPSVIPPVSEYSFSDDTEGSYVIGNLTIS